MVPFYCIQQLSAEDLMHFSQRGTPPINLPASTFYMHCSRYRPGHRLEHKVIPIREDEPQVVLGRAVNKGIMEALRPLGLASPWVR